MSVRVLVLSRAWVFLCAAGAFLAFGADRTLSARYGSREIAAPFGGAGETLLDLWSRWDAGWYLEIAHDGYGSDEASGAFFPLYPLLSRTLGTAGNVLPATKEAVFVGALAVSLAALGAGLYFVYRLTALELGEEVATLCIGLLAFFPMAVFFGVIYSESLFLALSAGAIWFARIDRWDLAGIFGAGAAATRSAGVLVVVPLALLYLLGPRGRGDDARPYLGAPWGSRNRRSHQAGAGLPAGRRTYPLRLDALWIALVPAALAAFAAYLALDVGDPLRFSHAQDSWGRELGHVAGVPAAFVGGLWEGIRATGHSLGELVAGRASLDGLVWAPDGGDSLAAVAVNLEAAVFVGLAMVATAGVLRRLPLAYGAYGAAALALALSYPCTGIPGYDVPLFSLPRFVAVIFPLFMWLALVVNERGRERSALVVSALLLGLYSAQWGTWQWVS